MRFQYDKIITNLRQPITVNDSANLVYVRPNIMRFGNPAGTLKVQLFDNLGFLITESNSVNMNTLGPNGVVTLDYAHGYTRFDTPFALKSTVGYFLGVAVDGHVSTETDHVGLIRINNDFQKVENNNQSSFDFELWERNKMTREIEFFDGFESSQAPVSGEQFNIANGAVDADITGLVLDPSIAHKYRYSFSVYRKSDVVPETREEMIIEFQYKPDAAAWSASPVETQEFYDETNVDISISGNQPNYTSNTLAGAAFTQYIIWTEIVKMSPGV